MDETASQELVKELYPQSYKELSRYVDILTSKGITWGLLGPKEADRVWQRHILNSLAITDLFSEGELVADVGSGAGLPGIPLTLARPDLQVVLIEPLLRRYNFLTETVAELGLDDRVRVERVRAEDCDEVFDVVTCRAVASLDKLLKWTTPLFYPAGRLLALKGERAASEVAQAQKLLARSQLQAQILSVRAGAKAEVTYVVEVSAR